MKVCTDSCLFGAWVGNELIKMALSTDGSNKLKTNLRILDIGTGTGLLSLMLAQQLTQANISFQIDAIELDESACQDAKFNIDQSPWGASISLYQHDIRSWGGMNYDVIISNPPFFQQSLKTTSVAVNMAHHDQTLTLTDLAHVVKSKLNQNGQAFILLPPTETALLHDELKPLVMQKKVAVRDRNDLPVFRIMAAYGQTARPVSNKELFIKDPSSTVRGGYSADFTALLKPFYLYL